jgi:hypothetical protein
MRWTEDSMTKGALGHLAGLQPLYQGVPEIILIIYDQHPKFILQKVTSQRSKGKQGYPVKQNILS